MSRSGLCRVAAGAVLVALAVAAPAGASVHRTGRYLVVLEQGRYELTPLHSGHLARYRMSFPIKGSYPDIRRFIDATLSTIPAAALEGLRIERKNVGDAGVSADLRFSIFVRNES